MPTEIETELEKLKKTNAELLAKTRKLRDRITTLENDNVLVKAEAATQMEAVNSRLEKAEEYQRAQLARKLAKDWFILPKFAEKLVNDRLSVKLSDSGEPVHAVLDETGKATEMTLDDLRTEFRGNSELAQVLIGSRASGGGAVGTSLHPPIRARTIEPTEKTARLNLGLR